VADDAVFPAHRVDVRVTLADDGRASVDEEYALTSGVRDPVFEFLGDACTDVGRISSTTDDRPADGQNITERGPWTVIRYGGSSGTRTWRVHYATTVHGSDAVVPIVMPAGPLETAPGGRGGSVGITFQWTGTPGAARVVMPRLVPRSPNDHWEATMLAMPSAIRLRVPAPAAPCRPAETGNGGGLEWRFSVFAFTMIAWAAAYLAWFGRSWAARS
jgi:hypothetical protein